MWIRGRNAGKLDVHGRVHDGEEALPAFNSYDVGINLTNTTTAVYDGTTTLFEEKNNNAGQVEPSNVVPANRSPPACFTLHTLVFLKLTPWFSSLYW